MNDPLPFEQEDPQLAKLVDWWISTGADAFAAAVAPNRVWIHAAMNGPCWAREYRPNV